MKQYPHYIIEIARQLRKRSTHAEEILWQKLRRHSLDGLKFRRQHHIGRYVADFYCAGLKLVIELEGGIHELSEQKQYDEVRYEELMSGGYNVLRIKNEEVLEDVENVLEKILTLSPRSPLPKLGEGMSRRSRDRGEG